MGTWRMGKAEFVMRRSVIDQNVSKFSVERTAGKEYC